MPRWGVEGRLPHVLLLNPHQVLGVVKVELGEDGSVLQKLESRRHQREGVPVLNGDVIQTPIVNAWPQGFVFLLHKGNPWEGSFPAGDLWPVIGLVRRQRGGLRLVKYGV